MGEQSTYRQLFWKKVMLFWLFKKKIDNVTYHPIIEEKKWNDSFQKQHVTDSNIFKKRLKELCWL